MDPFILLPIALAVAWAATRKKKPKKTSKKSEPAQDPTIVVDPPWNMDGPIVEPWRPGGPKIPPELPKPPVQDGPVGPKPFPGPSGGPKPADVEDPSPIEVYPGTTAEEIEAHDNASYGLFISSDCETIYEGRFWHSEIFMPLARELMFGNTQVFHHPAAVIYELLVAVPRANLESESSAQLCIEAWPDFRDGILTVHGVHGGYADDSDEAWDYFLWFTEQYPQLHRFLNDLFTSFWDDPALAEIIDRDWSMDYAHIEDEYDDDDIDFDPTGS